LKAVLAAARWQGIRQRRALGWRDLEKQVGAADVLPTAQGDLERLLLDNMLPFWLSTLDRRDGGYHLNHDLRGTDLGPARKFVISQAGTTWFFARLRRSPYAHAAVGDPAALGYRCLIDQFRDPVHGGYYWSWQPADSANRSREKSRTDLCAQAFVLYALSEYAIATGDLEARKHASELVSLIEERGADSSAGGYLELFERDWTLCADGIVNYHDATLARQKTFSCQVHLLEALTAYHELDRRPRVARALATLLDLLMERTIHSPSHVVTNVHHRDWRPVIPHRINRANYGHDLEMLWMFLAAAERLDRDPGPHRSAMEGIFCNAVARGMDHGRGGFYASGRLGGRALNHRKIWWVQAEAMLASIALFRAFGVGEYAHCFNRTMTWILSHQTDWERGEWFKYVEPDDTRSGDKAGKWRGPYHGGRSVLLSLHLLAGQSL
jgi:mannobiose 2-epimerase